MDRTGHKRDELSFTRREAGKERVLQKLLTSGRRIRMKNSRFVFNLVKETLALPLAKNPSCDESY